MCHGCLRLRSVAFECLPCTLPCAAVVSCAISYVGCHASITTGTLGHYQAAPRSLPISTRFANATARSAHEHVRNTRMHPLSSTKHQSTMRPPTIVAFICRPCRNNEPRKTAIIESWVANRVCAFKWRFVEMCLSFRHRTYRCAHQLQRILGARACSPPLLAVRKVLDFAEDRHCAQRPDNHSLYASSPPAVWPLETMAQAAGFARRHDSA